MEKFFAALGGRKNMLVLVVMIVLSVNDFVVGGRLSEETIGYLVTLAGIGVCGHTVVDGVKAIAGGAAEQPSAKKK